MSVKIDSATTSDDYTAACTIEDQWLSSGGYFIISDAEVYAQLQYSEKDGPQGYGQWGTEVHVPTGNGQIFKGTTGIRFRSFTPGTPATISAAIFSRDEPTFIIGSGGIATTAAGANYQHNGVLIGTENTLDFEDANGTEWILTDDVSNSRVQVSASPVPLDIAFATAPIGPFSGETTLITGANLNYTGKRIKIEVFFPTWQRDNTAIFAVSIARDGTKIGDVCQYGYTVPAATNASPIQGAMFDTPAAGAHTYSVTARRLSGTGSITVEAGAGGVGVLSPGFMVVTAAAVA